MTTEGRAEGTTKRERFSGLDGIRGLAALYVVFHHIFERAFPGYPADHAPWWAGWFIYGRFAVVVFIVLSGFSLALSPARHGWRLDGVRHFAARRARRILPAYLAALAFSFGVLWLVTSQPGQARPDGKSALVNGLLVQNLVQAPSPNKSFWSMAVEAQLYLVFPLLILLVRRLGGLVMVATVTLLVAMVGILGPHIARLNSFVVHSPPDLAALFALGILAAGVIGARKAWAGLPWPWLTLAAAAPVLVAISLQSSRWTLAPRHILWVDLALGPAVGCLLLGVAAGRPRAFVRLLDSRPIRSLGLSSYSLYLVHEPIVIVVWERIVGPRFHHGSAAFLVTVAIAVPATVVFARLFAAAFEQPFLRQGARVGLHRARVV